MIGNDPYFRLGLIGYPVAHSLSPLLHRAALASVGLEGEYALYPIPLFDGEKKSVVSPDVPGTTSSSLSELEELLKQMRVGALDGLNVTIPHKQTILPYLDEYTPAAQGIGAVNTLVMREDCLVGDNTDAPGFLAGLKSALGAHLPGPGLQRRALILGAGGSARAVLYALIEDGWQVALAARRKDQAQELASYMEAVYRAPPGLIKVVDLEADLQNEAAMQRITVWRRIFKPAAAFHPFADFSLLVNTTPAGMIPDLEGCAWPAEIPLPPTAAVYDLVYNPRETKLVRLAHQAGLPAASGLGMLVEQAALSFECWTGQVPDRKQMVAAVEMKGSP